MEINKKYSIIYADPPWSYRDKACNGGASKHYNTMTIDDIKNLSVKEISDDNCILFIWATNPLLPECFEVIKSWGFEYKTIGFTWLKTNKKNTSKFFFGLGRWTRGNTESCLIATKGKINRVCNNISQLVISPLREHSRKPDIVRKLIIDLVGDLPRIELFARQSNSSWDVFGNEVDLFENTQLSFNDLGFIL